jgi:hypothetical protein
MIGEELVLRGAGLNIGAFTMFLDKSFKAANVF